MHAIDYKYIGLISNHLSLFKRRDENTYNFRCPLCGDSKTKKNKMRGYLLCKGNKVTFYCHNCNVSLSFDKFLKRIDPTVHNEYVKERIADRLANPYVHIVGVTAKKKDIAYPVFPKYLKSPLSLLEKISSLRYDHPAKIYVENRKIPTTFHHKLFYCEAFKKWINEHIYPEKFASLEYDEPRVVIPYIDMDGTLFGVSGRDLRENAEVRYITIILDKNRPSLVGMDGIDKTKRVYVTEGPIDSFFLPNCVAMGTTGGKKSLKQFINDPRKFTIVLDNQPRNKEVCKVLDSFIASNYNVFIWPNHIQEIPYKDLNELVVKGNVSIEKIKPMVDSNTFFGIEAQIRASMWRKIDG